MDSMRRNLRKKPSLLGRDIMRAAPGLKTHGVMEAKEATGREFHI